MRKFILTLFFMINVLYLSAQTTLDTAADFNVKDIHGNTYQLYNILDDNQYVLLDFFTTSCGPCVTYAPEIQQSYEDFGSNQLNVFFLGINYGDDNEGVATFDSLYGITFPTVSGLNGHGNTVSLNGYNIQSWPTMVLIAPNRLILQQQIFPPSQQNLDSIITASTGIIAGVKPSVVKEKEFRVWSPQPNPVSGELVLRVQSPDAMKLGVDILSLTGTVVQQDRNLLVLKGIQQIRIPLTKQEPGMYFVRFYNETQTLSVIKYIHR